MNYAIGALLLLRPASIDFRRPEMRSLSYVTQEKESEMLRSSIMKRKMLIQKMMTQVTIPITLR